MRKVSLVVAATVPEFGIGFKGSIPWRIPEDLKFFRETTSKTESESKQNAVIMGRKTWESIPQKYRPLASRLNIVLTRNPTAHKSIESASTLVFSSFEDAMERLQSPPYSTSIESVFVIGGAELYNLCNKTYPQQISSIFLTKVSNSAAPIECDRFFPLNCNDYQTTSLCSRTTCKSNPDLSFEMLQLVAKPANVDNKENASSTSNTTTTNPSVNEQKQAESEVESVHEENQYLDLLKKIMKEGVKRGDRTGTGTLSLFGAQMRFSLADNTFPLLTTKRVFWRGVAEELLWFMNGSTSAKLLQDKKIRIWDGNSTREFLDGRGLSHYEEGDLGPVYGFQWRHFGAEYKGMNADYKGKGIDQLAQCIEQIKTNPNSRRIVMSAWNPTDLPKMALPPCHMFVQFYVAEGKLSCQMYQRSADMGLGVPFNIASYALLTRIVAQVCGLEAGEFVHTIGDAHIYLNHVDALKEQIERVPRQFPRLIIDLNKKEIDQFVFADFKIEGYKPQKSIKMKMAV